MLFFYVKFSLQFKTLFSLRAFLSPYSRAWNPYFFRFISGKRHKYAVIDTDHFNMLFKTTFAFLRQTMLNGGKYYYFNPYQSSLIVRHAFGFELSRWIPGIFTNKLAMRRVRALNGISFFFPSALFLLSLEVKNVSFAKEAKSLLIPTVAVMGTYFNHQLIDYPLLGSASMRLSTFIIDLTKQLHSSLALEWALEYSFNRYKYICTSSRSFFIKKERSAKALPYLAGDNSQNTNLSKIERGVSLIRQRILNKSDFLSLHFRNFRYFSDRYRRFWSNLLHVKHFYKNVTSGKKRFQASRKVRSGARASSLVKKFRRTNKGYSRGKASDNGNKSYKFIKGVSNRSGKKSLPTSKRAFKK